MKSTFWMTAQEAEDELKRREISPAPKTCSYIPMGPHILTSLDGVINNCAGPGLCRFCDSQPNPVGLQR